jgi:tRNA U34 2-thiouridine synthase MnmA/TrmU
MKSLQIKPPLKAIGLMSGGLDSSLAVKIIKDLNIDVYAIHFVLPWHQKPNPSVVSIAEQLQIPLEIFYFKEEFLDLVKAPKYGYGKAINPCMDCHAYQLKKAKDYMTKIGAEFVFTGEVLGQRPMSQLTHSLKKVEEESSLTGFLLRPLSAKLLPPTLIEQQGKVDREKLFGFSGRGRSELLALGRQLGIANYIPTGGGCLLADKNFANRLRDAFEHGYKNLNEIISLSAGRHFRLSPHHKIIVGRDDEENIKLIECVDANDLIFQFKENPGPAVILKGENPSEDMLSLAASIVKRYSKFQNSNAEVFYWPKNNPALLKTITAASITDQELQAKKI